MYKLIEYFTVDDELQWHVVNNADTLESILKIKNDIIDALSEMGVACYEILGNTNAENLIALLNIDNTKIFKIIK